MPSIEPQFQLPKDFQAFDPRAAMRIYHRNLPHWRQPGATYFLTFRLHDALPREVLEEMARERETWEIRLVRERAAHGQVPAGVLDEYQAFQTRTMRRFETVMDAGHGSCLLREPELREIVSKALRFFHHDRCDLQGFVAMPNHVHLLVRPLGEWQPEQLLHSWKGLTSHEINKCMGSSGSHWQEDTWDRIVRDEEHWFRAMRYIVRNPGKAKLLQGQSTVWVDSALVDRESSAVREESPLDEPW